MIWLIFVVFDGELRGPSALIQGGKPSSITKACKNVFIAPKRGIVENFFERNAKRCDRNAARNGEAVLPVFFRRKLRPSVDLSPFSHVFHVIFFTITSSKEQSTS